MSQLHRKMLNLQDKLDSMEHGSPEQNLVKSYGMNKEWTPSRRVLRTSTAYFLPDKMTQFSDDTLQFEEAVLAASVPSLVVANLGVRQLISLRCIEPTIYGPKVELEASLVDLEMEMSGANTVLPIGEAIRRPMYAPVVNISFIALIA